MNLITLGLGTGLLTMPWSTAGASIGTTVIVSFVVLLLNMWTCIVIVQASERQQEFDLGFLLGHLPKKVGVVVNVVVNTFVVSSQLLVLLGYALVITNALVSEVPAGSLFHNKVIVCLLSAVVLFLLSLLPQKYLSFSSTATIVANIYVVILLVVFALGYDESVTEAGEKLEGDICFFGLTTGAVAQMSNLMYSITIQACIPPMYFELEHRTVAKFTKCLCIAFSVIFLLFVVVSVSGYLAFGPHVSSDVLDNFPTSSVFGNAGKVAMALSIFGCFPLQITPVIAPVVTLLRRWSQAKGVNAPLLDDEAETVTNSVSERSGRAILTGAVVVLVTSASLWVPSLSFVNTINGAACAFGYTGLIPAFVGLYLLGEVPFRMKVAFYALLVGTSLFAVLGLFFTDNFVDDLQRHCLLW